MKILMDADCLIKLTKAGLKEFICRHEKNSYSLYCKARGC